MFLEPKLPLYRYDRLNGGLSLQTIREISVALSPASKHVNLLQNFNFKVRVLALKRAILYLQYLIYVPLITFFTKQK